MNSHFFLKQTLRFNIEEALSNLESSAGGVGVSSLLAQKQVSPLFRLDSPVTKTKKEKDGLSEQPAQKNEQRLLITTDACASRSQNYRIRILWLIYGWPDATASGWGPEDLWEGVAGCHREGHALHG